MTHWWNETVTNGDLILYLVGWFLFYVLKEIGTGAVQGWRKHSKGKSVLQEARERAARNPK